VLYQVFFGLHIVVLSLLLYMLFEEFGECTLSNLTILKLSEAPRLAASFVREEGNLDVLR
jgi:hypothetical protein